MFALAKIIGFFFNFTIIPMVPIEPGQWTGTKNTDRILNISINVLLKDGVISSPVPCPVIIFKKITYYDKRKRNFDSFVRNTFSKIIKAETHRQ